MLETMPEHVEETCQWCGGTIPAGGDACESCGAQRPRGEMSVPGLTRPEDEPPEPDVEIQPDEPNDEERAKQILKDLDAYVPESEAPAPSRRSDPSDDAIVIIGLLLAATVLGGLVGWFVAPPLIHDLFQGRLGVESDGPEAFRRLGAFVGALLSMLFGATLATMIRR